MVGQMASANAATRTKRLWASPTEGAGCGAEFPAEMSLHMLQHVSPMGVLRGRVMPVGKHDSLGERPGR